MIDIETYVKEQLTPLNIPLFFNSVPTGNKIPAQYITFLEVTNAPSFEASDREIETKRLIQVNIWSKQKFGELVNDVRRALESAGFERTTEYDSKRSEGDSHTNRVMQFAFFDDY